jgi:undecaprenyl diphosphate synthase
MADTEHNTGLVVTVAFDYGSRAELVRAAQACITADSPIEIADIDRHLYAPDLPPVDVLVRTSGETRISNFLLWQINGAAVYFTEKTWPDFDSDELDRALRLVRSN